MTEKQLRNELEQIKNARRGLSENNKSNSTLFQI